MMRLLKVIDRSVVVSEASVVIKAFGEHSLAKIGLQPENGVGRLPCFFAEGLGWLKTLSKISTRVDVRQQRPAKSKVRIQLHCLLEVLLSTERVRRCKSGLQRVRKAAQVRIVRFGIVCRFGCDDFLFIAGQFGA